MSYNKKIGSKKSENDLTIHFSFRSIRMGSLSPYDFEAFYHSICADLQTRGEVHSMSKQFSLMEDDNERYCFIGGGGVFFKILPRSD